MNIKAVCILKLKEKILPRKRYYFRWSICFYWSSVFYTVQWQWGVQWWRGAAMREKWTIYLNQTRRWYMLTLVQNDIHHFWCCISLFIAFKINDNLRSLQYFNLLSDHSNCDIFKHLNYHRSSAMFDNISDFLIGTTNHPFMKTNYIGPKKVI